MSEETHNLVELLSNISHVTGYSDIHSQTDSSSIMKQYEAELRNAFAPYLNGLTSLFANPNPDPHLLPSESWAGKYIPPKMFDSLEGNNPFETLLNSSGPVVITADMGMGKTALSRELIRYSLDNDFKIPVYINLNSRNNEVLSKSVVAQVIDVTKENGDYNFTNLIDGELKSGRIFVVFDGLDESANQAGVTFRLNEFHEKYPNTPFIVTCRSNVYHESLRSNLRLEINEYDCLEELADDNFNLLIESNNVLKKLGENPKYRGMMFQMYSEYGSLDINNISELFDNWLNLELEKRRISSRSNIDTDFKIEIYRHLAFQMQLETNSIEVTESKLSAAMRKCFKSNTYGLNGDISDIIERLNSRNNLEDISEEVFKQVLIEIVKEKGDNTLLYSENLDSFVPRVISLLYNEGNDAFSEKKVRTTLKNYISQRMKAENNSKEVLQIVEEIFQDGIIHVETKYSQNKSNIKKYVRFRDKPIQEFLCALELSKMIDKKTSISDLFYQYFSKEINVSKLDETYSNFRSWIGGDYSIENDHIAKDTKKGLVKTLLHKLSRVITNKKEEISSKEIPKLYSLKSNWKETILFLSDIINEAQTEELAEIISKPYFYFEVKIPETRSGVTLNQEGVEELLFANYLLDRKGMNSSNIFDETKKGLINAMNGVASFVRAMEGLPSSPRVAYNFLEQLKDKGLLSKENFNSLIRSYIRVRDYTEDGRLFVRYNCNYSSDYLDFIEDADSLIDYATDYLKNYQLTEEKKFVLETITRFARKKSEDKNLTEKVTRLLKDYFFDESNKSRYLSLIYLSWFDQPDINEFIINCAKKEDEPEREWASRVIRNMKNEESFELLLDYLMDENNIGQKYVIESFNSQSDRKYLEAIVNYMNKSPENFSKDAVEHLYFNWGRELLKPFLIEWFEEGDRFQKQVSAELLAEYWRDPEMAKYFIENIEQAVLNFDSSKGSHFSLHKSFAKLARLSSEESTLFLLNYALDRNNPSFDFALPLLVKHNHTSKTLSLLVDKARNLMDDNSEQSKDNLVELFSAFETINHYPQHPRLNGAINFLSDYLNNKSNDLRKEAFDTLYNIFDNDSIPILFDHFDEFIDSEKKRIDFIEKLSQKKFNFELTEEGWNLCLNLLIDYIVQDRDNHVFTRTSRRGVRTNFTLVSDKISYFNSDEDIQIMIEKIMNGCHDEHIYDKLVTALCDMGGKDALLKLEELTGEKLDEKFFPEEIETVYSEPIELDDLDLDFDD